MGTPSWVKSNVMALFRQAVRVSAFARQCSRVVATQHQQKRGYADMPLTLASPSDVYYHNVNQVDVPTMNGSIGIMPTHVPTLGVLKPGVVTVFEESGDSKKYFVSSGSVPVNPDSSVQILAEEAHPLDRFDSHAVKESLMKAQQDLSSVSSDKDKAEAQIALDALDALDKALH